MVEETGAQGRIRALHRGKPSDFVRAGFLTALGVALLALLALVVWKLSGAALSIIVPFALGTVLAMLLDPLVDRLGRYGISRGVAVFMVFSVLVLILVSIGVYGVPALAGQVSVLGENAPKYLANLQRTVNTFLVHHPKIMGFTLPKNADALTTKLSGSSSDMLRNATEKATAFLWGSVSTLLEAVITLIITFYLLLYIDRLRARLFYLAPERARTPLSQYGKDIGSVFSEYLRGLMIVSILYGLATMLLFLGLSLAHRDLAGYALLIGVAGGLLYTVPYLGPLVTALITFLIAFAAGGISFGGLAVLLTLVLNQIFDNIVTPRIVGGGVGLHPVASLFALTLGGALFGLWGLLLSVPVAASIQVILFRLFPKLTTPTPAAFLRAQGIRSGEAEPPKVMEGEDPHLPDRPPDHAARPEGIRVSEANEDVRESEEATKLGTRHPNLSSED